MPWLVKVRAPSVTLPTPPVVFGAWRFVGVVGAFVTVIGVAFAETVLNASTDTVDQNIPARSRIVQLFFMTTPSHRRPPTPSRRWLTKLVINFVSCRFEFWLDEAMGC
jgi:hypothetical protein